MLLGRELNIAKYFMQILIRFGSWKNRKCQKGIRCMSVLVYMYKKKNLMSFNKTQPLPLFRMKTYCKPQAIFSVCYTFYTV